MLVDNGASVYIEPRYIDTIDTSLISAIENGIHLKIVNFQKKVNIE